MTERAHQRRVLIAVSLLAIMPWLVVSAGIGAAGPTGPSGVTGSTGATGPLPACDGTGSIEAGDLPPVVSPEECDLVGRVVTDTGGIGVTVPGPGGGSTGYALYEDGTQVLDVETFADGTVVLSYVGPEPGIGSPDYGGMSITAVVGECDDTLYNLSGYIYDGRHDWWLRTSSIPGYLNQTNVTTAFRNGITHITHEDNNCGQPDNVSATSNYLGSTSTQANFVNGTSNCGTYDGKNVVDFGSMGTGGPFAYTCNNRSGGRIVESDIRFNTDKGQIFVANPGPSCQAKYDLESIMTHERGHTYGLNHVPCDETGCPNPGDDTHSQLTMFPIVFACDTRQRSLGNGDMRGLEIMY